LSETLMGARLGFLIASRPSSTTPKTKISHSKAPAKVKIPKTS
jgi:hypothetical protein